MKDLENSLGKALTTKELAEYLGVNEKTIRENYRQFGGVKIGRHYRFFTKEVTNALEKREEICGADQEERSAEGKGLQDTERSQILGKQDAQDVGRGMERDDRHGLLD